MVEKMSCPGCDEAKEEWPSGCQSWVSTTLVNDWARFLQPTSPAVCERGYSVDYAPFFQVVLVLRYLLRSSIFQWNNQNSVLSVRSSIVLPEHLPLSIRTALVPLLVSKLWKIIYTMTDISRSR